MTESIPDALRSLVTARAEGRCEYCLLSQDGQEARFHVDHVIPRRAGGPTTAANLALACVGCSLRKAAREQAVDPATGQSVRLFHPRVDSWRTHFRFEGFAIVGLSATGRATIDALGMNRPMIVAIREEQALLGRAPDVSDAE